METSDDIEKHDLCQINKKSENMSKKRSKSIKPKKNNSNRNMENIKESKVILNKAHRSRSQITKKITKNSKNSNNIPNMSKTREQIIRKNKENILNSYLSKEIEEEFPLNKNFIINQWKKIELMREEAPVDTMGADCCPQDNISTEESRYQHLIGLLLSSQTKDPITFSVINKLQKYGLTMSNINNSKEKDIAEIIYGVSFHNNKAKAIKSMTKMIIDDFNSKPPDNYKDVLSLPGIGPKMGNLYMSICFGIDNGIAVDTHVHRICNRLEWVDSGKCDTPEKTRKALEKFLPKSLFRHINTLIVGFGQTRCKAIKPDCENCLLLNDCEHGKFELKRIERMSKKRKLPSNKSKSKSKSQNKKSNGIKKQSKLKIEYSD